MPERTPPPKPGALRRLREAVAALEGKDRLVSSVQLAALAQELGGGLTVDLQAKESLGHPLVVLRPEAPPPGSAPRFEALSPREREVAALLAEGLRNKEIAARLFISVATVKDHVHEVLGKADLDSRSAVASAWFGR